MCSLPFFYLPACQIHTLCGDGARRIAPAVSITSVVKDRKVSGDEKSRTRDGDDAAIFA